jgi:hypothetical protein
VKGLKSKKLGAIGLIVLISAVTVLGGIIANAPVEIALKPYRVLVVIDVDWHGDPSSYVDCTAWAFHDVATLLKLWSIPFDVLRLDLNTLNTSLFLDTSGKAKYGVILWNCNPEVFPTGSRNWTVLTTAVKTYGISLISLANTFGDPTLENLLGINYVSSEWSQITDSFNIITDHFITRGYQGVVIPAGTSQQEGTVGGYGCKISFDTSECTVLAVQGAWPQLAVRDLSDSTKTVWIGGNRDVEFHLSPIMAKILRNAIFYCIGYGIYETYPNTIMLRVDDMGTSQAAYLSSWHYPQLTQDQIRASLIQPLIQHNATLAVMYAPGYPREAEQTVLNSWTLDWIDPFGTEQNLTSNYLGILEGISKDVLDIESHGWTHMAPNLTAWWDNQTEWANTDWYREFYDARYGAEVDVATQNLHFANSIQGIQEAFGTWPLSFAPAGNLISGQPTTDGVPQNYTYRLAALNGFGLASDGGRYCYLGSDMVIPNMAMTRVYYLSDVASIRQRLKAYGAWDIPIMVYFHDRDIAVTDPNYLQNYLAQLETPGNAAENPVQNYLSQDEFIGYMHANPTAANTLNFTFDYDPHYCKYFANHTSMWTLQLTDTLLSKLKSLGQVDITTDGNTITVDSSTYFNTTITLNVPPGTGTHTIQFSAAKQVETSITLSASSASISLGNRVTLTGKLAEHNGTGINSTTIMFSYIVQGFSIWIPLASTVSDEQGEFSISWIPQATGQFTVKAEWSGDSTRSPSSNSTTVNVTT